MSPFAPSRLPDDEETVTRPLLRPAPFMLRRPRPASLPDLSCDDEWIETNELPRSSRAETTITRPRRVPGSQPLPLIRKRQPSLPPVPAFTRPRSLPPVPAFTRPVRLPQPTPPPAPDIEVRQDLRVDWPTEMDVVPTSPVASFRPRQETMRGIQLPAPTPTVVVQPVPPAVEAVAPSRISEVEPVAISAPLTPRSRSRFRELWRAARGDAWTALLMLPIAVSLVSIVVLTVTALANRDAAGALERHVVTATDARGNALTSATVFVDGAARCQALPCALDLSEGMHWVTVTALGYDAPPSRAVNGDVPRQLDFVLASRQQPAAAAVAAVPTPAAVAPAPAPATTVSEPAPEPAPVSEPAPEPARSAPAPRAPKPTIARSAQVVSGSARLNINSIPAANVALDGRPLGRTPKIGVRVTPGRHTIVFAKGKKRVVRSTVVGAGKTAVVAARL